MVGINPIGLDWQRFTLAVDAEGHMLGCGQIKPHGDGSRELSSLAVQPEAQGQGIGKALVAHLTAQTTFPLYLTCRSELGTYYKQFGFRIAAPKEMPPYFYRIWRAFNLLKRIFPMGKLLVMVRDQ